jgi:Dna[CI] antecedent, DciA
VALRQPIQTGMARRVFGASREGRLALLKSAWAEAVGSDLAQRTEVLALEGVTLRLRVPDAGWRKVLHRMQPDILSRLRRVAGDLAPSRLGFQEGAVAPPPVPRPAEPEPVPVETMRLPESVAAGAAAIADPELRAGFEATAARYLARFGATQDSAVPSPCAGRDRVGGR